MHQCTRVAHATGMGANCLPACAINVTSAEEELDGCTEKLTACRSCLMQPASGDRTQRRGACRPMAKALVAGESACWKSRCVPGRAGRMRAIANEVPEAVVGAGTIRCELSQAAAAAALFGVKPGVYQHRAAARNRSASAARCRYAANHDGAGRRVYRTEILLP